MYCAIVRCLGCLFIAAFTSHAFAQVKCRADFSPMGGDFVNVSIVKGADGRLQALMDGKVMNPDVAVTEDRVRDNLNLKMSPTSPEAGKLNAAESSLLHLQALLDDPQLRSVVKIPFKPGQVRRMRLYDLQGHKDKYGGSVLMEAYDQQGKFLGRLLRAVFVASCT